MIDQLGHNRTWLFIIFNDTIINLYCQYWKTLEYNTKRLTFEKLSKYALAIYNLSKKHYF